MSTGIYTVIATYSCDGPRISRGSFICAPLSVPMDRLGGDPIRVGGPQSVNWGRPDGAAAAAGSRAGPRSATAATAAPTRATAAAAMKAGPKPAAGATPKPVAVATAVTTASPRADPAWYVVFTIPAASPPSSGRAPARAASIAGMYASDMPVAATSVAGSTAEMYEPSAGASDSQVMPPARITRPATSGRWKPNRATTRPVTATIRTMIVRVMGTSATPPSKAPRPRTCCR